MVPHRLPWYRYNYSLTVLPQYLELVILNLPGVLWRLSFGPVTPALGSSSVACLERLRCLQFAVCNISTPLSLLSDTNMGLP